MFTHYAIEALILVIGLYILYNIGNHFEKIDREIENQNCHINRLYEKFDKLPFKQKLATEEKRMKKGVQLMQDGQSFDKLVSPKVRKSNKSAKQEF